MAQQISKLVESRAFGNGSKAEQWLDLFNSYSCYYCGVSMYKVTVKGSGRRNRDPDGLGRFKTYDHLKKRMSGGTNSVSNLAACCEFCNNLREMKEVVDKVGHSHVGFKQLVDETLKDIRHDRHAIMRIYPRAGGLLQYRSKECEPVIFVEEAGASFLTRWENESGGHAPLAKDPASEPEKQTSIFSRLRLLWSRTLCGVIDSMRERFSAFSR